MAAGGANTNLDSIYTRDAARMPRGVMLCYMGKAARAGEPSAQERRAAACG